jgi:hypothetical protein
MGASLPYLLSFFFFHPFNLLNLLFCFCTHSFRNTVHSNHDIYINMCMLYAAFTNEQVLI